MESYMPSTLSLPGADVSTFAFMDSQGTETSGVGPGRALTVQGRLPWPHAPDCIFLLFLLAEGKTVSMCLEE